MFSQIIYKIIICIYFPYTRAFTRYSYIYCIKRTLSDSLYPQIIVYFHIYQTNIQVLTIMDTTVFITMDVQPLEIAHGFEEYSNGTELLSEGRRLF